jgi:hypothetical protein
MSLVHCQACGRNNSEELVDLADAIYDDYRATRDGCTVDLPETSPVALPDGADEGVDEGIDDGNDDGVDDGNDEELAVGHAVNNSCLETGWHCNCFLINAVLRKESIKGQPLCQHCQVFVDQYFDTAVMLAQQQQQLVANRHHLRQRYLPAMV